MFGFMYQAMMDSLGVDPSNFQLIMPFTSWNWPTASPGHTAAAEYDFLSTIPQWNGQGTYLSSGSRLSSAYELFLNALVVSADPVQKQKIVAQQDVVQDEANTLQQKINDAKAAYAKDPGVADNNPDFTSWLADPFGGYQYGKQVEAARHEYDNAATCERQGITPGQLTLHADRGSSMRAKTVALLLADLVVTKTHSRPYTSTDNSYSEALFKTAKYRPAIPERFGSLEHARQIFGPLFAWYNTTHRHSGLALLTPQDVHHGVAQQRLAARAAVLAAAYAAHPERFPRGLPTPGTLPTAVWINKPATSADTATTALPASARIDALEGGEG
jgi:hypothetical protein